MGITVIYGSFDNGLQLNGNFFLQRLELHTLTVLLTPSQANLPCQYYGDFFLLGQNNNVERPRFVVLANRNETALYGSFMADIFHVEPIPC